jgi:hypothetical protein
MLSRHMKPRYAGNTLSLRSGSTIAAAGDRGIVGSRLLS